MESETQPTSPTSEPSLRVAIFAPNPLLTVTIEARGTEGDDIHLHPGGQGIWVARMAGELGADPILCGFLGGETGAVLEGLLEDLPGERRLVSTAGNSGCYVVDRREGERELLSAAFAGPPSRHELDDLFSAACASALESALLVVCNPFPADGVPPEVFPKLVSDVRAQGTPVLVDLSTPRLDGALEGGPDLVKLNDWELAEFVSGPVETGAERLAGAQRLQDAGARSVIVTRGGEPALALRDGDVWEIVPPRFDRGSREGCGDSMMGGIAAGYARGLDWEDSVVLGAAAGAVNFLRHGLGSGSRSEVESLTGRVELRPFAS